MTPTRRDEWKAYAPQLQVFDTGPVTCLERALAEGDNEIVPVIERMAREWDLSIAPWLQVTTP